LAIAAKLSEKYEDIILLESNEKYGQETSSRNSEVIHSGIYYPENSLKAELCAIGNKLLYNFCEKYNIPHKRTGKLIIAVDNHEIAELEKLYEQGQKNNVDNMQIISENEIKALEHLANGKAAIYSKNTGIIDSHSLMKQLYHQAEQNGVVFCFNNTVNLLEKNGNYFKIGVEQEDYEFQSEIVINCAGLNSDKIAKLVGIDIEKHEYKIRYCKGSYFSYSQRLPIERLIYPIPHKDLAGLGVHITIDLGGRLRFGPDVEFIDELNYDVDISKRASFFEGAKKLLKDLDIEKMQPDCAGVRPKLAGAGVRDFIIKNEKDKNLDGLINLIGIESPGLTCCLSIADYVEKIISENLS